MQKKLFFNIKKIKSKLLQLHSGQGEDKYNEEVAKELGVAVDKIESMSGRMAINSVMSINDSAYMDSELEISDTLLLSDESHENGVIQKIDGEADASRLAIAMSSLNERERNIVTSRRLREKPETLENLSAIYNVSKERIRQIEENAIRKLKEAIQDSGTQKHLAI